MSSNFFKCSFLFFMFAAVVFAGCEESQEEIPEFQDYSFLSSSDRTYIREAHLIFSDHESSPVNVLSVFDTIQREVLRSYPYESLLGDFSLTNGRLELENSLPEGDLWGDYAEDGGFIRFSEVFDQLGSTKEVFKRHREFEAGSITDFDYVKQHIQLGPLETLFKNSMHVIVENPIRYVETAWHQQVGRTTYSGIGTDDYDYGYQSQEMMKIEMLTASEVDTNVDHREEIVNKEGWVTTTALNATVDVQGRLTLYRPTDDDLEANKKPEDNLLYETVSNNVRDILSEVTTKSTSTAFLGPEGAIEEETVVTTTVTVDRNEDSGTTAPFGFTRTTNTTVDVSYGIRNGFGLNEVAYRELDWREDYKDIELKTETYSFTYETNTPPLLSCDEDDDCGFGFGNYECRQGYGTTKRCLPLTGQGNCGPTRVSYGLDADGNEVCQNPVLEKGTIRILKTTDNPLTRNNIGDWKSTEETYTKTYVLSDGNVESVYETTGPEWLTDRIEVDPEYDGVGFAVRGEQYLEAREEHIWFGDDLSGTQKVLHVEATGDYQLGWKDFLLVVKGSHAQTGAEIVNELDDDHAVGSNTQGTYELTVAGGSPVVVNSDEWLNSILLNTGFGISVPLAASLSDSDDSPSLTTGSGQNSAGDSAGGFVNGEDSEGSSPVPNNIDEFDAPESTPVEEGESDETWAEGGESSEEFFCAEGGTIPADWVCDGEFDCSDGSDELFCD